MHLGLAESYNLITMATLILLGTCVHFGGQADAEIWADVSDLSDPSV